MRIGTLSLATIALVVALATSGCTHRLIPYQGNKAVKVYQDEDVYKAATNIRKQLSDPSTTAGARPYLGILLGLAEKSEARDIDGGTRVKIISSDEQGSNIEVLEGPYIGYKGFVPKDNLR
jgi:hypothetical protein